MEDFIDIPEVEIRCPENKTRLLLKLARPAVIDGANLLEVACRDCKRDHRDDVPAVTLVLHRFNVLGELVETVQKH